jgi:hypothetical protein
MPHFTMSAGMIRSKLASSGTSAPVNGSAGTVTAASALASPARTVIVA